MSRPGWQRSCRPGFAGLVQEPPILKIAAIMTNTSAPFDDSHSAPLQCEAGDVLFRPDEDCKGFVVLEKGTIRVSLTAANGREIVLYRVHPGEICLQTFNCLVEGRVYSAEGVAETALEGAVVPPDEFRRLLAEDASFRDRVFTAVAHRFADFEQLIEDVALTGFDARLARVLLRLADERLCVNATHETLAVEAGSGRAVVSRQLGQFAREGWVELRRGQTHILDRAQLERIAGGEGD